jgi:chromosome segregation ATPase
MNSTSLTQSSRQNAPQRQHFARWLLIPMVAAPLTLIAIASSYLGGASLQASESNPAVASGLSETQAPVASSILEVEQAKTQRDVSEQKYRMALSQLEATQNEQVELQAVYQDAIKRLDTLKSQNHQQVAERSTLKAQMNRLQASNQNLNNQVQDQKLQLATLQKRYEALENQKQQLTKENQQLRIASSQLEALKPELAQAHQTIARLSSPLNQKPDQVTKININGQQFPVTKELAAALQTERKQLLNGVERSTKEQQLPITVVK